MQAETQKAEASVWRLGPMGLLLASTPESMAAQFAEDNPQSVFFFAELGENLTHDENTIFKLASVLENYGHPYDEVVNIINDLQNTGLFFREAG